MTPRETAQRKRCRRLQAREFTKRTGTKPDRGEIKKIKRFGCPCPGTRYCLFIAEFANIEKTTNT